MSNSIQATNYKIPAAALDSVRPMDVPVTPKTAPAVLKPVQTKEERPVVRQKFDPQEFQQALNDILERLNTQMKDSKRELGFSMDDKINTFIVTVRNTETGEVIRQIPTEAVVKFAHNLEDLKGVLFNQTM